jgi:hypothetical protein
MATDRRTARKSLAIALAIVGVAGLSVASAAQLTVSSTDVVAGVDSIADCDADGVTVTYTPTYDAGTAGYVIDSVTIGDNDGTCAGTIYVTVTDAADAELDSGSAAYAAGSVVVNLGGNVVVEDIYGVAVAIG